jgi:hypothetical protein
MSCLIAAMIVAEQGKDQHEAYSPQQRNEPVRITVTR